VIMIEISCFYDFSKFTADPIGVILSPSAFDHLRKDPNWNWVPYVID